MQILSDLSAFREWRKSLSPNQSIGLVPTMGALHEGHASLVRQSVSQNDLTIVSIFVNPTQFGPNEDFERYPRTLESDAQLLESLGADVIFAPQLKEIYPQKAAQILFEIRDLDKKLCGASRPGHMNGVLQIVCILFHITQPTRSYFGQKDYQQFLLIKQMAQELHFPLEVIPCPIIRESDGLALSSRNRYMQPEERRQALFLSTMLRRVKAEKKQLRTIEAANTLIQSQLKAYPLVRLDYFEILNGQDLTEIDSLAPENHPHAFIAAWLGKTRLIDNMPL